MIVVAIIGLLAAIAIPNLVTARKPDDIPAFNRAMIELFSAGAQQKRPAA